MPQQALASDPFEKLLARFNGNALDDGVRKRLMAYYTSLGDGESVRHGAHALHGLGDGGEDILNMSTVPTAAREELAGLIKESGIKLRRSNGGAGEGAYFELMRDGLTVGKLDILERKLEEKIKERTGVKDWREIGALGEAIRAFGHACGLNEARTGSNAGSLTLLSTLLANVEGLPEQVSTQLQRSVDTAINQAHR